MCEWFPSSERWLERVYQGYIGGIRAVGDTRGSLRDYPRYASPVLSYLSVDERPPSSITSVSNQLPGFLV